MEQAGVRVFKVLRSAAVDRDIGPGLLTIALLLLACPSPPALGQCQLANPSFEFIGGANGTFDGWNQLDPVSASPILTAHGHWAARMSGPDAGSWAVSGLWQALDSSPGDQWQVSARVGHRATDPITGEARGIINVEWRNAADELISYESHVVLVPADPTDVMHRVEFQTDPAPPGTVTARILPGKLQSPAHEAGSVYFDHLQFRNLTPPTIDDLQWNDFPGGRTIEFAERLWRIKGPGYYGPGPDLFADGPDHVWVDAEDRLHMTVRRIGGTWYSTEIALTDALVYGDYIFTTVGRLDAWAPNVVLGLFSWQYPVCWDQANPWNLHCEFDVEISRWGVPGNDIAQFVTQPWEYPGNLERFGVDFTSEDQRTSFAFRLLPDRVEARSWRGGPHDEHAETLIHTWTYLGPHIPLPEQHRMHINFWQYDGPPANGQDHEIIIDEFRFVPSCADDPDGRNYRCFAACLAGPGDTVPAGCSEFDHNGDGDVDLADFAAYLRTAAAP